MIINFDNIRVDGGIANQLQTSIKYVSDIYAYYDDLSISG